MLTEVEQQSTPLREWKRKFLLDPRYKPTRANAVRLPTSTWAPLNSNGWYVQRQPYDLDAAEDNIATFGKFLEVMGELSPEPTDPRRKHLSADVSADVALPLLWEWRAVGSDAHRLSGLELALASEPVLQSLTEVRFVLMDGNRDLSDPRQRRTRSLNGQGETTLLQGRAPNGSYPGDASIFDAERITVQLHLLRLTNKAGEDIADPVPAIAVHLEKAPTLYIQS